MTSSLPHSSPMPSQSEALKTRNMKGKLTRPARIAPNTADAAVITARPITDISFTIDVPSTRFSAAYPLPAVA